MTDLLKKLEGGDRRSVGRVNEVVAQVLGDPSLFEVVFDGMLSHDPLVRMRSADAVEKITAQHSEYLQPYKKKLIQQVAKIDQQEVRWHVAQMFPRLELSEEEQADVVELLLDYLNDKSKIVKTFVMQALADLAERDAGLRARVIKLLEELTTTGSPAMRSRGRKLLEKLKRYGTTACSH
jgi:HEAT repeat protein